MLYRIGFRTVAFSDSTRTRWDGNGARPLITNLWYPAAENAVEKEFLVPPHAPLFDCGKVAFNAELTPAPAQFPLILFSHGTGGSAIMHGWLAGELARHGYIVAGVNHHGNTALEPYLVEGFARVWERPKDLSRVLDCLLCDEVFGPHIKQDCIGAAGFSLGGYTVIALAGGRLSLADFIRPYEVDGRDFASELPPEFPDGPALAAYMKGLAVSDTSHQESFRDERIRAVFAIAPALGLGFIPETLATIEIPVRLVVGEADTSCPPDTTRYIATHTPGAELTIMPGPVGHYTFLAETTELGKETMPDIATDTPGVDRRAIHQTVSSWAVEFFDRWFVTA